MPVGEFDYAKALIPVFNSLYERSEALLKRFNPCNVCDGVCERHRRGAGKNFCCHGCIYLGPNGCEVKALQCKLWVCSYDLIHPNNVREFDSLMWGIMIDASEFDLLVSRGSMEDSIAQAGRYYINNRDKREMLMKKAVEYVPRPTFFKLPEASSEFVKRTFPHVYYNHTSGNMSVPKPSPDTVTTVSTAVKAGLNAHPRMRAAFDKWSGKEAPK